MLCMYRMFFCFVLFFVIWWLKMKGQTNNFLNWIELNLEKKKSPHIFFRILRKNVIEKWRHTFYHFFLELMTKNGSLWTEKTNCVRKEREKNIYIMEKFSVSYILSPPFFYTCEMKGKQKKEWERERAGKKEKKVKLRKKQKHSQNSNSNNQEEEEEERGNEFPKSFHTHTHSLIHNITHI